MGYGEIWAMVYKWMTSTKNEQSPSGPEEAYDTGFCILRFRRKSDDLLLKLV
jgi:hypothetical protein